MSEFQRFKKNHKGLIFCQTITLIMWFMSYFSDNLHWGNPFIMQLFLPILYFLEVVDVDYIIKTPKGE